MMLTTLDRGRDGERGRCQKSGGCRMNPSQNRALVGVQAKTLSSGLRITLIPNPKGGREFETPKPRGGQDVLFSQPTFQRTPSHREPTPHCTGHWFGFGEAQIDRQGDDQQFVVERGGH